MGNQSAECKTRTDPELIVAVSHLEANQRKTGEQFVATEKMTINMKDMKMKSERQWGGKNQNPLDLKRSVKVKTDPRTFVGT